MTANPAHFGSLRPTERAATEPIDFGFGGSRFSFGNALNGDRGHQPRTEALLRASTGIFSTGEKKIAERVASLELEVVTPKRQPDGSFKVEVVDDPMHPLVALLAVVHPDFGKYAMFKMKTQQVISTGKAFWLKVGGAIRSNVDQSRALPVELHPMPPDRVERVWRNGVINHYVVQTGRGGVERLDPDLVIDFNMPDPENMTGSEGVLGPNGVSHNANEFAKETMREHFRHNAMPDGVLKGGAAYNNDDLKQAFAEEWANVQNRRTGSRRGIPPMIPSDAELIQFAMQTGVEIVPLLEHFDTELLMALGVPQSVLGRVVSGDRSSADVNQHVFDLHTVLPYTRLDEGALTRDLAHDFDPMLSIRYKPFIRPDKEFALKQERQDLELFVRNIDTVVEERNLPPVEWGARPVATFNQVPYTGEPFRLRPDDSDALGDRTREEPDPDPEPEPDAELQREHAMRAAEWARQEAREAQFVPDFTRRMRKAFKVQRDDAIARARGEDLRQWRAYVKSCDEEDWPTRFKRMTQAEVEVFNSSNMHLLRITADEVFTPDAIEWTELFNTVVQPSRINAFTTIAADTLTELDGVTTEFIFTETQAALLERDGAAMVRNVNATTQQQLARTLAEATIEGESIDQIVTRIRAVFRTRSNQASTIARTEILKSSQEAQIVAFDTSEVVEAKRWNTSLDAAVRDQHRIDGQVRAKGELFQLRDDETGPGETALAPGVGGTLTVKNIANCRCFLTPVRRLPAAT